MNNRALDCSNSLSFEITWWTTPGITAIVVPFREKAVCYLLGCSAWKRPQREFRGTFLVLRRKNNSQEMIVHLLESVPLRGEKRISSHAHKQHHDTSWMFFLYESLPGGLKVSLILARSSQDQITDRGLHALLFTISVWVLWRPLASSHNMDDARDGAYGEVKSSHLYLSRVALSALGWYQ